MEIIYYNNSKIINKYNIKYNNKDIIIIIIINNNNNILLLLLFIKYNKDT